MDIKIKFGIRLKKLRKQKNFTQEKLSELADIDRSYISDIERGIKSISIDKLDQLANAFQIELCELLRFD
ncbi:MAG: helix-turn-helix domain-containing protein [Fusobacteriaceae bacterium]